MTVTIELLCEDECDSTAVLCEGVTRVLLGEDEDVLCYVDDGESSDMS